MKLKIGYFYKDYLNLYGDNGNIEVLVFRAKKRGFDVDVENVGLGELKKKDFDLIFMGGGPDAAQKEVYKDILVNKGPFLFDYINSGGVGLFICGSYQLLGKYYKSADGTILDGLGVFNLYTQSFGNTKFRCVGNTLGIVTQRLVEDPFFKFGSVLGDKIVGFENHGGRTYLDKGETPFATILEGFGNNGEDKTEGIYYKSSIGTYFHGPLLSKNPHIADFLIAKSLRIDNLEKLDDSIIISAHQNAQNLRQ